MTNKMSKSAQIRNYVAANPTAKAKEVADALGLKSAYVSSTMWAAKQKAKPKKVPKKTTTDKSNWKQLELLSSDTPMVEDTVTGTTPSRMAELAYEVAKTKLRMQGRGRIELFEPKADPVNHPAHYKYGGIETIDFIEAKELGYNLGNVVKYLARADHKGNRKQDLEKAKWYLERELSTII